MVTRDLREGVAFNSTYACAVNLDLTDFIALIRSYREGLILFIFDHHQSLWADAAACSGGNCNSVRLRRRRRLRSHRQNDLNDLSLFKLRALVWGLVNYFALGLIAVYILASADGKPHLRQHSASLVIGHSRQTRNFDILDFLVRLFLKPLGNDNGYLRTLFDLFALLDALSNNGVYGGIAEFLLNRNGGFHSLKNADSRVSVPALKQRHCIFRILAAKAEHTAHDAQHQSKQRQKRSSCNDKLLFSVIKPTLARRADSAALPGIFAHFSAGSILRSWRSLLRARRGSYRLLRESLLPHGAENLSFVASRSLYDVGVENIVV